MEKTRKNIETTSGSAEGILEISYHNSPVRKYNDIGVPGGGSVG